jgi:endonuclease III
MDTKLTNLLIQQFGQKYSEILGINLRSEKNEEVFKWFLASILFGAPITENAVIKTYKCFEKHKVLTPEKILETGWDGLVEILDEGSYTRYDFKTADKLLLVMNNLMKGYGGNLNNLHAQASDSFDLEKRLNDLGKGIGEVTVSVFLRELRGLWKKADPKPTPLVVLAAGNLGIAREETPEKVLEDLKKFWKENEISGKDFVDFETVLLRFGKDFCRKKKCDVCGFREFVSCQQVVA